MNPQGGAGPGDVRQGLAITSLVLGVLANVCLWFLAGIPAIVTGHIALHRARQSPDRYGGAGMAIAGLTRYFSLVLGAVVLAVLLARSLPEYSGARGQAQRIQCINNLKQLGLAARVYASNHEGRYPPDFASLGNDLGVPGSSIVRRIANISRPSVGIICRYPENISYEYLTPGASQRRSRTKPLPMSHPRQRGAGGRQCARRSRAGSMMRNVHGPEGSTAANPLPLNLRRAFGPREIRCRILTPSGARVSQVAHSDSVVRSPT
jgi:hypothetical protein